MREQISSIYIPGSLFALIVRNNLVRECARKLNLILNFANFSYSFLRSPRLDAEILSTIHYYYYYYCSTSNTYRLLILEGYFSMRSS